VFLLCGIIRNRAIKKQGGWLSRRKLGGDSMSVADVVMIIFLSMTFVVTLIKLMIYIADKFSNNRK